MLRGAQNPAKYMVQAVFSCFGVLQTSQETWFTRCCDIRNVQNLAKYETHAVFWCFEALNTLKNSASRRVSMLRSDQHLARYVILALFRCFEALKILQNTWFMQCFNASNCSNHCMETHTLLNIYEIPFKDLMDILVFLLHMGFSGPVFLFSSPYLHMGF